MLSVDLDISERDGLTVATLRGELDVADAASVASALAAAARGARTVVVDLAGLQFIDCSGIGALVSAARSARHGGGDLLLAAPQQHVQRVLAVTRTASAFAVYGGVAEAASSGARPGPPPVRPRVSPSWLRMHVSRRAAAPWRSRSLPPVAAGHIHPPDMSAG
jgi:anti-anti-sigma factor